MKRPRKIALLSACIVSLMVLTACEQTLHPDYAVKVVPTAQGSIAVPPTCPTWTADVANPYDNQPVPQFGCAQARNLAAMIENPDDLVQGRPFGNARGVTEVGAIRRYDNNQPRGLIWTGNEDNQIAVTTSPASASSMSGDITGGARSSSSSAAAAAAEP